MICNFVYLYILFLSLSLVLSLILFIPFFSLFCLVVCFLKIKVKKVRSWAGGEDLGGGEV